MGVDPNEFYTPKIQDEQLTGMIKTKEPGLYSARLRIPLGILTVPALGTLAAVAAKHGRGEVYLTARLGVEIPGIPAEAFPTVRAELAAGGVALAGCGPRVRSTVTCKGSVCPHGNIDTFATAWKIDQRYNDAAVLPHKFKMAVAGCASSCSKPQLNDVGLVGVFQPVLEPASCVQCGICAEACHVDAVRLEEGVPAFDAGRCVCCGDCAKACPASAIAAGAVGLDLYAGGRWGREKQVGLPVARFLTEDEAVEAVGRVKAWYTAHGRRKERLGKTMVRVGLAAFQQAVAAHLPPAKWVELSPDQVSRFCALR